LKIIFTSVLILLLNFSFGQPDAKQQYTALINTANLLYNSKDYKNAGLAYNSALRLAYAPTDKFEINGKRIARLNSASCWALAGNLDSAFIQLDDVVTEANNSYSHLKYREQCILNSSELYSLREDKRWEQLLDRIHKRKLECQAKMNMPLVDSLNIILVEDQLYRQQVDSVQDHYGTNSKEMKELLKDMHESDSLNLVQIRSVLDRWGWLGTDVIGESGSLTLFLVMQHADLKTQEKYLPFMKEAVKNGCAKASDLAMLEDRIAIEKGKKQMYGTQISINSNGVFSLDPVEDEINLNERRVRVGLEPIEVYLKTYNSEYKFDKSKKK
jgi:hypothetical protein